MQDPGSLMPVQDQSSMMPVQDPGSLMPMQDYAGVGALGPIWGERWGSFWTPFGVPFIWGPFGSLFSLFGILWAHLGPFTELTRSKPAYVLARSKTLEDKSRSRKNATPLPRRYPFRSRLI